MKNLIYLLAIEILIIGCGNKETGTNNYQMTSLSDFNNNITMESENRSDSESVKKADDPCIYCDNIESHDILSSDAAKLIQAFQVKFEGNDINCGGTWYNPAKVHGIKKGSIELKMDSASYITWKFHICCSDKNDPYRTLYAAFEDGICVVGATPARNAGGQCLISDKSNYFPKFIDPKLIGDDLTNALEKHNPKQNLSNLNQTREKKEVDDDINFIEGSQKLKDYLPCGYTSFFNYDLSIGQIILTNDVVGFRYYFGYSAKLTENNKIRLILVGVNIKGENVPNTYRETSLPHGNEH